MLFKVPIGTETYAIFLKYTLADEQLDWTVFSDPFSRGVWQFLLLYSFFCTLVLKALEIIVNEESRYDVYGSVLFRYAGVTSCCQV